MRRSKFSESQRLAILAEQDGGKSIEEICRKHQVSPATLYKWKQALATQQDETKSRLHELEQENKRLKKMFAELSIDHEILQEGYDLLKKWQAQDEKKS
jgi:putative transposase